MGGNSFVYILHKEFAWHPATLIESDGKKAKVSVPVYADEQAICCDGGRKAKNGNQMAAQERGTAKEEPRRDQQPVVDIIGLQRVQFTPR